MKTFFLSGGGSAHDSYELDKKFVESLTSNRILYLPIASEKDSQGFSNANEWIVETLSPLSKDFLDIRMMLDLNKISDEYLAQFNGIYIGGGNVYHLADLIQRSNFKTQLQQFLVGGGKYYGGSAGAIILGKTLAGSGDIATSDVEGLDFFNGLSFACHYLESEKMKVQAVSEQTGSIVLAMPETTGLIVKNTQLELVGKACAHVFYPHQLPRELGVGLNLDLLDLLS